MRALWLLTVKNLKLLLRSRSSALIIIFAPLLIILLLGLSYNNSEQFGLNIGVYSTAYTEDVNSFIRVLEEEEFTLSRYEQLESCTADIKSNAVHTCISIPESLQVSDNQQKIITFYIDPSRVNLVSIIQETLQKKFNLKSLEISQELSGNLISRLLETKDSLIIEEGNLNQIKDKTSSASLQTDTAKKVLAETAITVSNDEAVIKIRGLLQEADGLIDNAKGSVNGAGLDEEKREKIRGYLSEAQQKLESVSDQNQSGQLQVLQEKLTAAAKTINDASASMEAIKNTLTQANEAIASLQASLSNIRANIEQQKITAAETVSSPLVTKIEKVSQEGTYLNYLFPGLLVLVVMFSSILLGTTLVMIEKNSPAFLRNFFVPVRRINFIISIYLTNVILTLIEILIILGISLFFLEDAVGALPNVALILFLAGTVFTFLGMAIGYLFTSEETGVLASISLGSILLFTSGVILPLEGITPTIRNIIAYNPFVVAEKLVREVFIFNAQLNLVAKELALLIGYAAALFLLIWGIESLLHQQLTQRFLRKHHKIANVKKEKIKK